jgi:hypothetical protein
MLLNLFIVNSSSGAQICRILEILPKIIPRIKSARKSRTQNSHPFLVLLVILLLPVQEKEASQRPWKSSVAKKVS